MKNKLRIWDKKDKQWLKQDVWLGHYDDLYVDDLHNILSDPDYIFIWDTNESYNGLDEDVEMQKTDNV